MPLTKLEEIFDCNTESIIKVDLSLKDLKCFPEIIYELVNLKMLDLTDNYIEEISPEIANLVNLKKLYFSCNKLNKIPKEFGNLSNLKKLNLAYNYITEIPPEFGNLINLKALDLRHNELTSLPTEIGKLIDLEKLFLEGNNFRFLPKQILNIKNSLIDIEDTTYDIDNLDVNCEILVFKFLNCDLTNLPIGLKQIYFKKELEEEIKNFNIKLPFGCEIIFY